MPKNVMPKNVMPEPAFDPDAFLNGDRPWTVFTADRGQVTIAKRSGAGEYRISYQDPQPGPSDRRAPQDLRYNETMRTLDTDEEGATVHRSISFWQRPDGTRAVFASYHRQEARAADDVWPIEVDDKGTWGADDG